MSWLDTVVGSIAAQSNGTLVGSRATFNFQGIKVSDDSTNNRINVATDTAEVHVGPMQATDYTLTAAQASASTIVVTGSFDGSAIGVVFPVGVTRANTEQTAVVNLSGTDFNLTIGASVTNIPSVAFAVITWGVAGVDHVTVTSAGGGSGGTSLGTYAARPSAGSTGRIYVPIDGPVSFIDSGTAWLPLVPGGPPGKQPSAASGWTLLGTPTLTDSVGGLYLSKGASGGVSFAGATVAAPTNSFTAAFMVDAANNSSSPFGILLRDAGTTFYTRGITYGSGSVYVDGATWSSTTVRTADASSTTNHPINHVVWLRCVKTGGNWVTGVSCNGIDWTDLTEFNVSTGAFTATAVGIYVQNFYANATRLISWSTT